MRNPLGGLALTIMLANFVPAAGRAGEAPVTTVAAVDLDRYLGVWHEVAKIPNRFQKHCAHGTTATYTLRDDGRLTVLNQCYKADGGQSAAEGVAKVVAGTGNAQLEVSFVSFLGWRPFWGDYWIVGLDDNYEWAVIGTPDRKYGWILARDAVLAEPSLTAAFAILERNGYRREDFELSPP